MFLRIDFPSRSTMHRIRLRGPWTVDQRDEATGSSATWIATRRFQRPAKNIDGETVRLVFVGLAVPVDVLLNGLPLGRVEHDALETGFDITDCWLASNMLELAFRGYDPERDPLPPADASGPRGEVVLEFS
jgi:hypothetical protein